ncbi:unnamed protein product [Sphacelaria rigidula]
MKPPTNPASGGGGHPVKVNCPWASNLERNEGSSRASASSGSGGSVTATTSQPRVYGRRGGFCSAAVSASERGDSSSLEDNGDRAKFPTPPVAAAESVGQRPRTYGGRRHPAVVEVTDEPVDQRVKCGRGENIANDREGGERVEHTSGEVAQATAEGQKPSAIRVGEARNQLRCYGKSKFHTRGNRMIGKVTAYRQNHNPGGVRQGENKFVDLLARAPVFSDAGDDDNGSCREPPRGGNSSPAGAKRSGAKTAHPVTCQQHAQVVDFKNGRKDLVDVFEEPVVSSARAADAAKSLREIRGGNPRLATGGKLTGEATDRAMADPQVQELVDLRPGREVPPGIVGAYPQVMEEPVIASSRGGDTVDCPQPPRPATTRSEEGEHSGQGTVNQREDIEEPTVTRTRSRKATSRRWPHRGDRLVAGGESSGEATGLATARRRDEEVIDARRDSLVSGDVFGVQRQDLEDSSSTSAKDGKAPVAAAKQLDQEISDREKPCRQGLELADVRRHSEVRAMKVPIVSGKSRGGEAKTDPRCRGETKPAMAKVGLGQKTGVQATACRQGINDGQQQEEPGDLRKASPLAVEGVSASTECGRSKRRQQPCRGTKRLPAEEMLEGETVHRGKTSRRDKVVRSVQGGLKAAAVCKENVTAVERRMTTRARARKGS